ncbi:MAG: lytic transglycosylase domain-containing protein [Acidobacteria bacterium]|nr:lytic transglycosylase domain-containing protein [Acidobacteriota bacterium]
MLQLLRGRRWIVLVVVLVVIAGIGVVTFLQRGRLVSPRKEANVPQKPEAPPDLAKLRDAFTAGVEAMAHDDGAEAVKRFSSFTFGNRAVEEYRLYYLANAYQLTGDSERARVTLAALWRRDPQLIYAHDAAFNLANLYTALGDRDHAADVYATLARRAGEPAVAASARWATTVARVQTGDVSGAFFAARNILIESPRAPEAANAVAFVHAITGTTDNDPLPLTPSERVTRGVAFLAAGDPQNALDELNLVAPSAPASLHLQVELQRGLALSQLRRYEDSNKILEPLTSVYFKYSIPALRCAARNYAILSASIDPNVNKVIKEKKQVGTTKVRVGKGKAKKTVTKPKFQTVSKTVKLVDLAKKKKKDEYDRLASERLKDLLSLPIDDDVRFETLNALADRAIAKNQIDYLQQVVPQIVKLDTFADPALQYLWDRAWAAYTRSDLAGARTQFRFIADTYTQANVRRQSEYWYARTVERLGGKAEAAAIYQKLANGPYVDLYARHSIARGAKRVDIKSNPLEKQGADWREIAEKQMPRELELAYELTALSSMRDALLETRKNTNRSNTRFAEALMADYYNSTSDEQLMYRSLKRAWPQLATVDQDTVPAYFLRMYYPLRYGDDIEKYSKKNGVDPNVVRGLILQESYYNPEAKSGVGATGLMQLMPATAAEHARHLHVPFATSRLENPTVNVELGTYHLRMLMNLFGGNVDLAVASYNAGQGNVMKWRRAAPHKPMDEFLESIPFPETRNYVKRVRMLQSSYARINGEGTT